MKIEEISVEYIDHMGTDLSVCQAARVSFDKQSNWEFSHSKELDEFEKLLQDGWEDITEESDYEYHARKLSSGDTKLIKFLAREKHYSPFNHCFISVRVTAPIFVARQMVKHKFMPWNEVSRRYVDEEPSFYFPTTWRAKAENVKQGSSNEDMTTDYQELNGGYTPTDRLERITERCLSTYSDFLDAGMAPEQARMVLPQHTMTTWIWSGTLGAFSSMLALRLDPHTQYESRLVAEKVYGIVKEKFPVSVAALLESYNA